MEFDQSVCIGSILGQDYEETGTIPEDAENFVDYSRSIDGVKIGVLIEERSGKIKGSFRAKDESFRVDILAKDFNGGGHACAAGFNVSSTIEEFYPILLKAVGLHLQQVEKGNLV